MLTILHIGQVLRLDCNEIGDSGGFSLGEALLTNDKLTMLSINNNKLGSSAGKSYFPFHIVIVIRFHKFRSFYGHPGSLILSLKLLTSVTMRQGK